MRIAHSSQLKLDPGLRPGYLVTTAPWLVDLADGRWLLVPQGFWSDGASIPPPARLLIPPLPLIPLGVAHDWAVRLGARIEPPRWSPDASAPVTPAEATELALAFARLARLGWTRRTAIWAALEAALPWYWQRRGLDWRPA